MSLLILAFDSCEAGQLVAAIGQKLAGGVKQSFVLAFERAVDELPKDLYVAHEIVVTRIHVRDAMHAQPQRQTEPPENLLIAH